MSTNERGQHSAASSVLGYFYQVRYALLESLIRLRKAQEFIVKIETLDDVVFEKDGAAPELLQIKHHLTRVADLTDSSPDLWKTIRIWCEAFARDDVPEGTLYFLITTAQAVDGHAAYYLRPYESRNLAKATERLSSTAESSVSQANAQAYQAYRSLNLDQRGKLLQSVFVFDAAPRIQDLDAELREVLFYAVEQRFLNPFLQRLEGWWYRRAIQHLVDRQYKPILSDELESETTSLREQFKQESLPINDEILSASVDASGYQDRIFVHQLRLIEIGNPRIIYAIRNFFRAFEQRSRWVREDLLLVGELERYEERLIEEWDILFQQTRDKIGVEASEETKKRAAQTLYEWVETATHRQIRSGVSEPFISRGTYQILSDTQRVGWHLEFKERLRQLLEPREVAS
ncbi:MAG: hypothetical protein JW765_05255 [Deltaproteobacteria bacterium]|nr:hypothetical protein [Candidatus Zymogenaceae bacterium]